MYRMTSTSLTRRTKLTPLHYKEEDGKPLSQVIRSRLKQDNKRFWAGDNISEYISDVEKDGVASTKKVPFQHLSDDSLVLLLNNDQTSIKLKLLLLPVE